MPVMRTADQTALLLLLLSFIQYTGQQPVHRACTCRGKIAVDDSIVAFVIFLILVGSSFSLSGKGDIVSADVFELSETMLTVHNITQHSFIRNCQNAIKQWNKKRENV